MSERATYEAVERKARSMFGTYAETWLHKANRSLAQLSPYEMARSEEGARVVLAELERTVLAD